MTTTEQSPVATLQRRVRPAEGQAIEIPIHQESGAAEATDVRIDTSHEAVALDGIERASRLRAGRFLGSRTHTATTEQRQPVLTDETSSVAPVVDYLESRGRQAKLGRKLLGMSKWTPKAFEWPKSRAPQHLDEAAAVNATPNVAYKGKHRAKLGAHVLQIMDTRAAAKIFAGQDNKTTGGKHAKRGPEVLAEQVTTPSQPQKHSNEVHEPGRHRAESSANKDFRLKAGGSHKAGVPPKSSSH